MCLLRSQSLCGFPEPTASPVSGEETRERTRPSGRHTGRAAAPASLIFNLCGGASGWLTSSFVPVLVVSSWVCARRGGVQDGCFFGLLVVRGRGGWVSVLWPGDEDVGVALLPLPGGDQPVEQVTQLMGGDGSVVVPGFQAKRVQRRRPGTATRLKHADDRVRPARGRDVLVLAPAVGVTQDPLR